MPPGAGLGQTQRPTYLSMDASDDLYVIDGGKNGRLQRRDRQGRWTVLVEPGPARDPLGLGEWTAVAAAPNGNIYVAGFVDSPGGRQYRLLMLDSKGRWTAVAAVGHELGQVSWVTALATDSIGRLYVADQGNSRLQVRDVNGKWYELPAPSSAEHSEPLFWRPSCAAVDGRGGVYIGAFPVGVLRWMPQPNRQR